MKRIVIPLIATLLCCCSKFDEPDTSIFQAPPNEVQVSFDRNIPSRDYGDLGLDDNCTYRYGPALIKALIKCHKFVPIYVLAEDSSIAKQIALDTLIFYKNEAGKDRAIYKSSPHRSAEFQCLAGSYYGSLNPSGWGPVGNAQNRPFCYTHVLLPQNIPEKGITIVEIAASDFSLSSGGFLSMRIVYWKSLPGTSNGTTRHTCKITWAACL